jgi:prevent-host-death family protein
MAYLSDRHRDEKSSVDGGDRMCYILCVMNRVGVRELRQNLSVYLRRVRRGESLEVTERGQPVALLQPIVVADDKLAQLEAHGLALRRGAGNLADLPRPAKIEPDPPLSEVLDELREDSI